MSQTHERRPGGTERRSGEVAAKTFLEVESSAPRPQIAEEWDRRRLAERRYGPVPKRRTEAQDAARIELLHRHSARIFGIPMRVLDDIGVPHMRDPINRKVRLVPIDRVDDVLAWVEHRLGIAVAVVEAGDR